MLYIIDKICLIYPGSAKCMHKTILQYRLMRGKYKLPVKMVIGVQKFPFCSHAWLTWKETNEAVFELEENIIRYSIIFDSDKL